LTLVVGILCGEDGAVIAADRQATLGAFGVMTVGQPVTKVKILGNNLALFSSSGDMGFGQQLEGVVSDNLNTFANTAYLNAIAKMQPPMRALLEPRINIAKAIAPINQGAAHEALVTAILAARFRDGLKLIEMSPIGGFTFLTHEMPFVCIGSGKQNADPLLGYLWSIYFRDGERPSLDDGILLAFWTIVIAINLKTFGVGFDPDVFVLARDGANYRASQVEQAQLQVHNDFIAASADVIRKLREASVEESGPPPTLEG
jgi:20S proteasome alpha/beta subunit